MHCTALTRASDRAHVKIASMLLKVGATLNVKDVVGGNTALIGGCDSGHVEIVRVLLEAGANRDPPFSCVHATENA